MYNQHAQVKDSRVKWLGLIPEHWDTCPSNWLFSLRNEKAKAGDKQLTASQKYGVIYQEEYLALTGSRVVQVVTGSEILKHTEKGDFVISMRSFQGGIEFCHYTGCVSSAYVALIPSSRVCPKFFGFLLKSKNYIQALQSTSNLVRDGQALRYSNFRQVRLPLIPFEEQVVLGNFLEQACSKIEAQIMKHENLIRLLKEKRQAIVNSAVTKGLNAKAPLKDSGLIWLGSIPEHWTVTKLKFLGVCQNGVSKGGEYFGEGYPFINYGDVYNNFELPLTAGGLAKSTPEDQVRYSIEEGDILFTRTSEVIDEIGLSSVCMHTIPAATFSGFLIRFRPLKKRFNNLYSKYYFRASMHVSYYAREMNMVTRASLSQDLLGGLAVILPPLNEQKEIGEYLENEFKKFDRLIEKASKGIAVLYERKNSLISNTVTGKIKISV